METFELEIVTPNGVIFNGQAQETTLPGSEGEFGVLPQHVSLVTPLTAGVIDFIKEDGSKESIVINWGYVNVASNRVCVLVQGAVALKGSDESEVAAALSAAKELLVKASDNNVADGIVLSKIEEAAKNVIG